MQIIFKIIFYFEFNFLINIIIGVMESKILTFVKYNKNIK